MAAIFGKKNRPKRQIKQYAIIYRAFNLTKQTVLNTLMYVFMTYLWLAEVDKIRQRLHV